MRVRGRKDVKSVVMCVSLSLTRPWKCALTNFPGGGELFFLLSFPWKKSSVSTRLGLYSLLPCTWKLALYPSHVAGLLSLLVVIPARVAVTPKPPPHTFIGKDRKGRCMEVGSAGSKRCSRGLYLWPGGFLGPPKCPFLRVTLACEVRFFAQNRFELDLCERHFSSPSVLLQTKPLSGNAYDLPAKMPWWAFNESVFSCTKILIHQNINSLRKRAYKGKRPPTWLQN